MTEEAARREAPGRDRAGDWDRSPRFVDIVTGAPGLFGGREVLPHPAWCWAPHGRYDTHRPESWTRVVFSDVPVDPD